MFRFDTEVGAVIPRVFLDDTDDDRAAVLGLVDQASMYPLADFDGTMKYVSWTNRRRSTATVAPPRARPRRSGSIPTRSSTCWAPCSTRFQARPG